MVLTRTTQGNLGFPHIVVTFLKVECYAYNKFSTDSSVKSLAIKDRLLDRSLIYIKNNRGPKIDCWSTPASTSDHQDDWPFKKTLWNLFVRSSQSISVVDQTFLRIQFIN